MSDDAGNPDVTALTAEVVFAYVAKNAIRSADLPDLIDAVHRALQRLSAPPQAEPEKREPPVPIRKSITPDFLISLGDGRRYKSLKRHLKGRGLTPEQYREKWGLPPPILWSPRTTPSSAPSWPGRWVSDKSVEMRRLHLEAMMPRAQPQSRMRAMLRPRAASPRSVGGGLGRRQRLEIRT